MRGFLAIASRDLRAELSSYRLQKGRLVAAAIASVILLALALAERRTGGFSVSRLLATVPLGGMVPLCLVVIGLSRASTLLSVERREGTLPLLLLTRVSGWEIVGGKLAQALVMEATVFLAALPALLLPLVAVGLRGQEIWLVLLGCCNVLFFALALGLLASIFGDGRRMMGWCLLLFLPWTAGATPLAALLPSGRLRDLVVGLQWLNPCEALAHARTAAGGISSGAYWEPLLVSHALGWCFLLAAGLLLPRVCRWQAGTVPALGGWKTRWWQQVARRPLNGPARTRLLSRNPVLWLCAREQWPTVQLWLLLVVPGLGWGWLAWVAWAVKGLNLTIVLAIAAAVTWGVSLLFVVPGEAARQLVEDRHSGAMELLLCTPLGVRRILRGQWLSLSRRYLVPVSAVLLTSAGLMLAGYVTYGFGGMLDTEDRGLWLFSWAAGIVLVPVCLAALCWVTMSRALWARTTGEAVGMASLQVLGMPSLALWATYSAILWAGWPIDWWKAALLLTGAFVLAPGFLSWRARRLLLDGLRQATAHRYSRVKPSFWN